MGLPAQRSAATWDAQGTPHLSRIARLARIALARAGDMMIGRSDCAKGFAGQKVFQSFTGTL